ncbi:MAG: ABC transporter permease [Nitriliruptoraceae bacterium]
MILLAAADLFDPSWVVRNSGRILEATWEHIVLTVLSVVIGLLLSCALSIVALRRRRLYRPILSAGSVLYTIPSLAMFALLVPFTGFSMTTAVIALVTYTLLILVKNIVTGIDGVPSEIVEAAIGMGYEPRAVLLRVQLPLALPVIVAGIRIATVTVIGLVTVTALIGLGGLGRFILSGFRVLPIHPTQILVGTFASILLAITGDVLLLALERVLTPWSTRKVAT